jgi:multiple sugar transport system permease protein
MNTTVNTNVPTIRRVKSFRTWLRESSLGTHMVMVVVLIVIFVPVLWLIGTTFKDRLEFSTNTAAIIPSHFSLVNYEYMFSAIDQLPTYMANSFILAIGTTLIQVLCSSLAGYAFSRLHFRGRDLIFVAIIVSMFIPRSGGLMALYELMTFLHLRNSLFGLILLFGSGVPVTIFIMRQTFLSVPREIEESALIDGANWFMVFWKIALPLAAGGIVVVATLAFIGAWSDFLTTYTLIDKDSQMTISVGIQKVLATSYEAALSPRFRGQFAGEASDATMLVFAAFPVVLLYALLQKWFMKGLMEGAVKL